MEGRARQTTGNNLFITSIRPHTTDPPAGKSFQGVSGLGAASGTGVIRFLSATIELSRFAERSVTHGVVLELNYSLSLANLHPTREKRLCDVRTDSNCDS